MIIDGEVGRRKSKWKRGEEYGVMVWKLEVNLGSTEVQRCDSNSPTLYFLDIIMYYSNEIFQILE